MTKNRNNLNNRIKASQFPRNPTDPSNEKINLNGSAEIFHEFTFNIYNFNLLFYFTYIFCASNHIKKTATALTLDIRLLLLLICSD